MNEISKIIIPGNTVPYDLRDDYARERINNSHLFVVSPLMTGTIDIYTLLGRVVEPYEGLMLHILCTNNNNDSITPTFIRLAATESPIEIEYSNFIRRRPINGGIYSFVLHYIPEEETTPAHWNFYPIDDTLKSKGVEIIEYTTEAGAAYAQVKQALSQNILPVVHYIDTNADNYEYWLPLYEYATDKTHYIFSASTAFTSSEDISLSYIRINLDSTTWTIDNRGINTVDIPTIAEAKGLFYGTCQTNSATAAKIVTGVADWPDSFFAGQTILIKFQYGNNVKENLTLSINGSTAAPIVAYDGVSPAAIWAAGSILLFIYSGTDWRLVDGADGKSAYQYAQDGGYTGTEEEFAEKLANECIDQTARDYAAAANARIDLFTSLDAGSTTGDAELQDIRIGFDGKSYDSAGSAVRGQAEALKNSLDFMSEEEGETTTTTVRNPAVTNLLDGVNLTNNMIVNNSGVETASTNYSLTDYIPITYNHYLTYLRSTTKGYDAIGMVAFYDGNKNFIKRLSEYNGDVYTARVAYQQMASSNNAGYVRFCIGKNADRPSLIVTDGETSEKSRSDYNNYYITITVFEPTGRTVTKLKDGVVTPEKTSFLHKSRNVLDDSNLKFGFIESDGSISDSKFYKYTDKCAVTAGSTLRFRAGDTYQGVRKIAFYNGETLLNVLSYGGYANYVRSCTVPATATHAVFCIGRAMDKKMVIEGDSYPDDMREYGVFKLDSQQLPTPADYIHAKGIGINNGIPGGWCKTQASDADLSLASTLDYTDYISGIDAIASAHSDYVTVTSPGNDATNTYPIKYYTLVPPGDRNYMRKPIPTVIVIGGIHGGESAGAYAVRTLFVDLCENHLKDEHLNYLHNNVRFVIFPVANPYGFGGTYKNGNGVNLNRNFSYGWDDATYESSDKLYGGASAFSEAETQYIKSVIDNNQNVLCVLDIHSNNDAALNSQWKYVNWLSMCTDIQSDALENAALNQIQGLTMRLYEMGKITEEDGVCGYTGHTSGQGMCKSYAASKGIWALTAEGCVQLPSDTASYSKDVQRINAEMVENLVINILRCASYESGR